MLVIQYYIKKYTFLLHRVSWRLGYGNVGLGISIPFVLLIIFRRKVTKKMNIKIRQNNWVAVLKCTRK